MNPLACSYCGRFVSYADIGAKRGPNRAVHRMVTPDSAYTYEEYETYHVRCQKRAARRFNVVTKAHERSA